MSSCWTYGEMSIVEERSPTDWKSNGAGQEVLPVGGTLCCLFQTLHGDSSLGAGGRGT